MRGALAVAAAAVPVTFGGGCQIVNTGTEIRTEEQMLPVSFENAEAEKAFAAIIYGTERETHVISRIGCPSVSLFSRTETVAFNAHCNDCIRAMDKDSDLRITQKEAEDRHRLLVEQGKIGDRR